jgi:uncharacterized protein YkwD
MSRVTTILLRVLLGVLVAPAGALGQNGPVATAAVNAVALRNLSSDEKVFPFGSTDERHLFALANQARADAGMSPLQPDQGLTDAARAHAEAMAAQQQLSHQFDGEPGLPQRLAASSKLHFDLAGENVAYAGTVEQAEDNLMHSPHHRENILSSDFNAAGFAIVQSASRLYVVQDFAHILPSISAKQAHDAIGDGIARMRMRSHLSELRRVKDAIAKSTACAMAQADSLKTPSPQGRYILRYTAMQPDDLPTGISKVISDPSLNSFASGSCYAKTSTYPNGAYWVALIFY